MYIVSKIPINGYEERYFQGGTLFFSNEKLIKIFFKLGQHLDTLGFNYIDSDNGQFVSGYKGHETPEVEFLPEISNYREVVAFACCLRKLKINWTKREKREG